jgi:hypothetical protein
MRADFHIQGAAVGADAIDAKKAKWSYKKTFGLWAAGAALIVGFTFVNGMLIKAKNSDASLPVDSVEQALDRAVASLNGSSSELKTKLLQTMNVYGESTSVLSNITYWGREIDALGADYSRISHVALLDCMIQAKKEVRDVKRDVAMVACANNLR